MRHDRSALRSRGALGDLHALVGCARRRGPVYPQRPVRLIVLRPQADPPTSRADSSPTDCRASSPSASWSRTGWARAAGGGRVRRPFRAQRLYAALRGIPACSPSIPPFRGRTCPTTPPPRSRRSASSPIRRSCWWRIRSSLPIRAGARRWAKSNPGRLNFATAGVGTLPHLTYELFKMETGIQALKRPLCGGAPALTACDRGAGRRSFRPGAHPGEKREVRALAITVRAATRICPIFRHSPRAAIPR